MTPIHNIQSRKRRTQAGFTVVELSVAVAIAGILLVGAISLVQTVLQTSRANDTTGALSRVFAQIEKYYNNAQDYSGINTGGMVGLGVFQGPFTVIGNPPNQTVNSRFGFPVAVQSMTNYSGPAANRAYAVTVAGIPQKVCADIVTAADAIGVKAIAVQAEGAAAGTTPVAWLTTLSNLAAFNTGANGIVKGSDNNGLLNVALLAGANGCNVNSATVSVALINAK